jgi:uncharacterized protein (TIGR00297 family)
MRLLTLNKLGIVVALLLAVLLFFVGMQSYYGTGWRSVGRADAGSFELHSLQSIGSEIGSVPTTTTKPNNAGLGLVDFSGVVGLVYILAMFWFLALSAVSTWWGKERKKGMGLYEYSRGYKNVLANGLGPLLFALVVLVSGFFGFWLFYIGGVVGFLACVAAITADKFSSEIGVLDGPPVMIFTGRQVRRGVSGGVTMLGFVAGFGGAVLASVLVPLFFGLLGVPFLGFGAVAVIIGGFIGTVADSMFGFYETKKIGNKHSSNFLASLVGGFWGMALFMLFILIFH